ncbi:MAG: hypothetical protein AB2556_25275 [Candidatus Thiodiazotropha sp.]
MGQHGRAAEERRGAAKGTRPLLCRLGAERTTPQKKKRPLDSITSA